MNLQHEIERLLALHRNAARKEALPVIDEFRAGPSIPTRLSGHVRKPGWRPASGGFAMKYHISVYAPVIDDAGTGASLAHGINLPPELNLSPASA